MTTLLESTPGKSVGENQRIRQVIFRIKALYGIAAPTVISFGASGPFDIGQVCLMLDPHIDPSCNIGMYQAADQSLFIRYGIQIFMPNLYRLIRTEHVEPGQLYPLRAVMTSASVVSEDATGLRTAGDLTFLPGGIWSGARGQLESYISADSIASFAVLAQGRSAHTTLSSQLSIQWPVYLGGSETVLPLEGSMILEPLLIMI